MQLRFFQNFGITEPANIYHSMHEWYWIQLYYTDSDFSRNFVLQDMNKK